MKRVVIFIFLFFSGSSFVWSQSNDAKFRKEVLLNASWETIILDHLPTQEDVFVDNPKTDSKWKRVNVPHNWDQYYGYRRTKHGNLHGTAWYKKTLKLDKSAIGKRLFLFFEGVSSYADVWVNGKKVGAHKGGRTTFTLDITKEVFTDKENLIVVKASHPSFIADLPWVCGGCSGE